MGEGAEIKQGSNDFLYPSMREHQESSSSILRLSTAILMKTVATCQRMMAYDKTYVQFFISATEQSIGCNRKCASCATSPLNHTTWSGLVFCRSVRQLLATLLTLGERHQTLAGASDLGLLAAPRDHKPLQSSIPWPHP